jgi:uroporphyrinogen-III decarboxylase
MTNRQKLLNYVKNGGDKFICSPQIGAGAGFDAKMVGRKWLSEPTFEDTKRVCEMFDMVPLYNFGLPDLTQLTRDFKWVNTKNVLDIRGRRVIDNSFETPHGNLVSKTIEEQIKGGAQVKYPVTEEGDLKIVEYYLDALLEVRDYSIVSDQVGIIRKALGEDDSMDIQWSMQPYELMCFPDTMNTAIFAMECPELFKRLMDKILRLDEFLLKAVAQGGADFVFLGGPGSEMISPRYYEDYLVPYSKIVTDIAHENGLMIYSHICSPIEPMLTMGYYNRMGIDLFETLSEAPVGNVKSMPDAFSKISPEICTRGNIGLDKLLLCTPREIKEISLDILEAAAKMNRKHILAASDYMFYDTPAENVHAMCEAVREFNGD